MTHTIHLKQNLRLTLSMVECRGNIGDRCRKQRGRISAAFGDLFVKGVTGTAAEEEAH
jgi:hypothetical protein